jgi:hypothetical protein
MTAMTKRVTHPLDRHQSDRNRPSSILAKGIALGEEHVVLYWDSYLSYGPSNVITFKFVTRCMHEVKIVLQGVLEDQLFFEWRFRRTIYCDVLIG